MAQHGRLVLIHNAALCSKTHWWISQSCIRSGGFSSKPNEPKDGGNGGCWFALTPSPNEPRRGGGSDPGRRTSPNEPEDRENGDCGLISPAPRTNRMAPVHGFPERIIMNLGRFTRPHENRRAADMLPACKLSRDCIFKATERRRVGHSVRTEARARCA